MTKGAVGTSGGLRIWMASRWRSCVRAIVAGSLVAAIFPVSAQALSFRRLAPSTVAFASDGTRYAAWQVTTSSPIVVLDTRSGRQVLYGQAGCSLMSEEGAFGPPAAAGRFLMVCPGSIALLDAATGVATRLPKPAGPLDGEWREVGARYVEGNADPHDCSLSPKEAGEGDTCLALYDIASGALSYRRESQVPDLDRAGAPPVCRPLRGGLGSERNNSAIGEFAYSQGLLVGLNVGRSRLRLTRCRGRETVLAAGGQAENLDLAAGLLTWDTAHPGNSSLVGVDEAAIDRGTLWTYALATHRRRGWRLPREATLFYSRTLHAVLGHSAHAGNTLFWIAAATVNGSPTPNVETATVFAAKL